MLSGTCASTFSYCLSHGLCDISVRQHLKKTIQAGGGTVGHSSVEDSIATLDLVRWHVLNGSKPRPKPPAQSEKS